MSAITTNSLNSNSSNDSVSPIPKGYGLSTHKKDMTREEIEKAAKEAFKKCTVVLLFVNIQSLGTYTSFFRIIIEPIHSSLLYNDCDIDIT